MRFWTLLKWTTSLFKLPMRPFLGAPSENKPGKVLRILLFHVKLRLPAIFSMAKTARNWAGNSPNDPSNWDRRSAIFGAFEGQDAVRCCPAASCPGQSAPVSAPGQKSIKTAGNAEQKSEFDMLWFHKYSWPTGKIQTYRIPMPVTLPLLLQTLRTLNS